MIRPTRRAVTAALPAVMLARSAAATPNTEFRVKGLTTYSESAMVMSVSTDGRSAITLRFCRFPDAGLTWLWCHIVRDGVLYAFTQHDLPCGVERLAEGAAADYRAAPMEASLMRAGKGSGLRQVRIAGALPFHRSRTAPLGPGAVNGHFKGLFTVTHALSATVLKDRDEVYGTLSGDIAIAGQRWTHEGVAKFHEQRQINPRFEAPFCYSWLGGEGLAATTLLLATGATGGWLFGQTEDALADMAADAPGDLRAIDYRLKSGRRAPGRLSAIVRYEVPIFGRPWRGSFVRGLVDGRPVVGVMNDWTAAPDIYAAAHARLG